MVSRHVTNHSSIFTFSCVFGKLTKNRWILLHHKSCRPSVTRKQRETRMILRNAAAAFLLMFSSTWLRGGRTIAFTTSPSVVKVALQRRRSFHRTASSVAAKPKRGNVVDSYQTVSVNCSKCNFRLFRYKKKNGTKSNLIKCFVERIAEDCGGILPPAGESIGAAADTKYCCPSCGTAFARPALIRGLPALKLVGGKTRMTKK